jgi:hypothetical protein
MNQPMSFAVPQDGLRGEAKTRKWIYRLFLYSFVFQFKFFINFSAIYLKQEFTGHDERIVIGQALLFAEVCFQPQLS